MATSTIPTDPLLTPAQLARYLGLPVGTLYEWRTKGTGPIGFRVGRHTRYRFSDVQVWLEAQRADNELGARGRRASSPSPDGTGSTKTQPIAAARRDKG